MITLEKLYRDTPLYKKMDSYTACAFAEGFCEGEGVSEDEILTAWQWLHDTRQGYQLQGWYGRTLHDLLASNSIAI
jgi:hypothetical protein